MSEEERSGRRQSEPWPLEALERLYDEAVCHGADATGGRDGGERYAAPLDLLASSTIHVPQLVLLMAVLEEASEAADADVTASVAGEVAHCSAGLMRLGQRALQAHARDVGYDPDAWRAEAVIQTAVALSVGVSRGADDDLGLAALELRRATVALADAIAAVASDRMAVPGYLASALSGWLGCYVRASELATPPGLAR
jgi:hypothetical protein